MDKLAELHQQLVTHFGIEDIEVHPLGGGASDRRYYKILFKGFSYFSRQEIILMEVPLSQIEMADDYMNISYYLRRRGIPRPRLLEINRQHGWIFLEPAAGEPLNRYLNSHGDRIAHLLPRLVEFLLMMQEKALPEKHCPAFRRFFDRDKFMFEFKFHVWEQLLNGYWKMTPDSATEEAFFRFAETLSGELAGGGAVFVHRDFQSSNIFYDSSNKKEPFQIIDFQDARSGSEIYDLVSLLWDSYVDIPENVRADALEQFYRDRPGFSDKTSREQFKKLVDWQVVQRKLHDAGAFVYCLQRTGSDYYLQYVNPAVEMAVTHLKDYPVFSDIRQLLQQGLQKKA